MKFNSNNILKSFFIRAIVTIALLSIISTSFIYYFEKDKVFHKLANNITHHVNQVIKLSEHNIKISDEFFIKHIKKINFSLFKIYDANENLIFTFPKKTIINAPYKLLEKKYISNKIYYKLISMPQKQYFLLISYPIIKDGELLGFIEGIKAIDKAIINNFEKQIKYTILSILLIIIIFSLAILPLIYLAYKKLNQHREELLTYNIMTINTLGNTIALRDSDTNEHNYRVTIYAIELAKKINLKKKLMEKLIIGSFLHDIGKIGISDNILLKNGKLTNKEFETIKEHVVQGVDIINGNKWLELGKDVILYHHEKYDGTGYPNKISGKNIPKIARIFAIVDVFDAITSKRPYKEAYNYEKAIKIMRESSKTHFDPEIFAIFVDISYELYKHTNLKSHEKLKKEVNELISSCFLQDKCLILN